MRITEVQAYPLALPLVARDLPASVQDLITPVIVKVSTDDGITGFGEAYGFACAPVTAKVIEAVIRPVVIGRDPLNINQLWAELYRTTYNYGRTGTVVAAISGVEMAFWDLAGKAYGIPLYQMLGGRCHDKLKAYASPLRYPDAQTAGEACRLLKGMGFKGVKPHERAIEAVAAIRAAVGDDTAIMLDVNTAWDVHTAVRMARTYKEFNLYWLEEPVWPGDDYRGLAQVRREAGIPLAAGENEYTANGFMGLISSGAVDFVQPSVFKMGGVVQEKKVFTLAASYGVKVAPHCWSLGPAMAATLHICFSEPSVEWIETMIETPEQDILTNQMAPRDGWWELSDTPGLGVEVNEDTLARYTVSDGQAGPSFWST